jgi:hypothetical protein
MNQTQKRLSIINYAISITDVETIQLQVLKLASLKTDVKIQEIITAIQAENYAQAQQLITRYLEAPTENILQRSAQEAQAVMTSEAQDIIDEFDLFITSDTQDKPQEIDINDFIVDTPPTEAKKEKRVDYEALLNIDVDNVMTDTIKPDTTRPSEDTFFHAPKEKVTQKIDTTHVPKDTFFDTEETTQTETTQTETLKEAPMQEESVIEETVTFTETELPDPNDPLQELKPVLNVQEKEHHTPYKTIPYIDQKRISMQKEYPPVEITDEISDSVANLLHKISQEGYTEKEILDTLDTVKTLTEESRYAEAAQLLLICAATESRFAQFMLARELYKGVLLDQNISEGFNRMYSLAMGDYPEALCDLAQFYEHGVGTGKDKKKAEQFYKEAMDFGIKRAEKHHARLTKKGRGLFGSRK